MIESLLQDIYFLSEKPSFQVEIDGIDVASPDLTQDEYLLYMKRIQDAEAPWIPYLLHGESSGVTVEERQAANEVLRDISKSLDERLQLQMAEPTATIEADSSGITVMFYQLVGDDRVLTTLKVVPNLGSFKVVK